MITYSDLGKLSSFSALMSGKKATVKDVLTAERVRSSSIRLGGGLKYNWAAMPVTDPIIDALQALSDEAQIVDKYKEILSGVMMNTGEKRLVLHHLTRGNVLGASITADNEELLSDFNLYFECTGANCNLEEDEIRMVVLSALDKGFGYAQTPVGHEKIAEVWDTDILEYIYFEIDGPSEDHHIVLKGKESSR